MRARYREGLIAGFLLGLFFFNSAGAAKTKDDGLSFLVPPGCVPADNGPPISMHIFVWSTDNQIGNLELHSSLGSFDDIQHLKGGLYQVSFIPKAIKSKQTARFSGTWKSNQKTIRGTLEVNMCPNPTGLVKVRADPEHLLAGHGRRSIIDISVTDSEQRPISGLPLEITTNVGTIKKIKDLGNGNYRTDFIPPDDAFPQVGIIMVANPVGARLDRVAVGRVVIPITARVELPGKTAPRTKIMMTVAKRAFGPVVAPQDGKFVIPILVPPGYGKGKATSVDRVGNRKSAWINLFLPETNQLGLWAYPHALPADGRSKSRLLVTTIDRFGKPTSMGNIKIVAEHGQIGKIKKIARGLFEAYYLAPASMHDGIDHIEVKFPKGGLKSKAFVDMKLLPGPTSKISLSTPELLVADGKTKAKLKVEIKDEANNPVEKRHVELKATNGQILEIKEVKPGLHEAIFQAHKEPSQWTVDVKATVSDQGMPPAKKILLSKQSLTTDNILETVVVDGTGRTLAGEEVKLDYNGKSYQMVTDQFGRARFKLARLEEGVQSLILNANNGRVKRSAFISNIANRSALLPIDLDPVLPPNEPLSKSATIGLFPAPPVDLTIEVSKESQTTWIVRATIKSDSKHYINDRKVAIFVSQGKLSSVTKVNPGVFRAKLELDKPGWKSVTISAVESKDHVGAVYQLQEGGIAK
jgi:hypothetical protein